eukprot:CAMPEP_0171313828 /NCGR_PEP_ID=MMETSP0816-20121228/46034_1 /TAXON_ID=420281 /ORGANISM="Proboscia inermis, Strain CCAP1064/1" /LENGTH=168 /DNA_ID=CAMNT_0011801833 /DNA_START=48 /DNA_END=551 /DNA_ORIENTATION=+
MNATENDSNLRVIDDDDVEGDIVRLTFDEDVSDIVSNLSDGSSYHTVESENGSPSKFPDKKKRRRSTVELRRSTEKARLSTLQQYAVLNFDLYSSIDQVISRWKTSLITRMSSATFSYGIPDLHVFDQESFCLFSSNFIFSTKASILAFISSGNPGFSILLEASNGSS